MRHKTSFPYTVKVAQLAEVSERRNCIEWLEEQVGEVKTNWDAYYWGNERAEFSFERLDHALLFKLTWGGV